MFVRRPDLAGVALAVIAVLLAGCVGQGGLPLGGGQATSAGSRAGTNCPTSQPAALAAGQKKTVTITTPKGTIVIDVDASTAPIATGNFVALAACGYYDGVVFQPARPRLRHPGR